MLNSITAFISQYVTPLIVLFLFVLDVLALLLGIRERKERKEYMERLERAARVYSREAYEFMILRLIQRSRQRVYCCWHSLHLKGKSSRYVTINDEFINARRHPRDVDVRIMTVRDPSRLAPAFELVKEGIEVRFNDSLQGIDLRFTLVDDTWLAFGIPEAIGETTTPSREGIDISGRKLAAILKTFFLAEWANAVDYDSYGSSLVTNLLTDGTNSMEMIADQFDLPFDEVKRLALAAKLQS